MKFNLVSIRPQGFLHSSAFDNVKESLAWSLAALGHEALSTENSFAHQPVINVIFGAELVSSPGSSFPGDAIVFNLEQPSHPNMASVRKLAEKHVVWDYSRQNVAEWNELGIDARHLPIGYTPNLTRIPKATPQDIDVCFLGWMTPRRVSLIAQLKSAGLKVFASDSCYGGARDQILSRSKVVLNLHHDGRTMFEIVRCSYLWANSKCVVTEQGSDDDEYVNSVDACAVWNTYDGLVTSVQTCVSDTEVRHLQEQMALSNFQKLDFTESVRQVLTGQSLNPVLTRYQAGLREGDMKDFLPTLRGLAKGQVLEIGVRDGASTSALLLGLEERGGTLTSIDVVNCIKLWKHPQWEFCQADSKAIRFQDNSFDMALIDGDHSPQGFLTDLTNCLRWVKPGGLILCHDISPLPNHTKEAAGGDWPSEYVGKQFFAECARRKLRHFVHPGTWGLGVIVKDGGA